MSNKPVKILGLLIVVGTMLYIISDCYIFNTATMMLFNDLISRCAHRPYPNTYFRKNMHRDNYTYFVYLIKVGQIMSSKLNESQIDEYSNSIKNDLLWFKYSVNQTAHTSLERKALFKSYFIETIDKDSNQCPLPTKPFENDTIDFFKFIQYGGITTENHTQSTVSYYNLLPIHDVLNDSDYVSRSTHKYHHINDEFYIPKLYTYTLSVDVSGYLPSLELRFGEISDEYQHDKMKHLMLNGNKRHALWAGEFYYFYDYKYQKYVIMLDNASGHWKPKSQEIPKYFERLLYGTLFPKYNATDLLNRDSLYDYVNYYRPLVIVGHHDYPWHELKSILFPVVGDIKELAKQRKEEWLAKERKNWRKRVKKRFQKHRTIH